MLMATKVETKDMILYAYRIENEELSTGVSDFTLNLLKKLESEEEQAGKAARVGGPSLRWFSRQFSLRP